MRKLIAFLALLLVLLTSAAHLFAQDRPSLLEVLQNDPDGRFTSLLAAIDAAGLTDALSGDGPYTLLAPTNDAFAASLEAMGMTAEQAMADTDTLSKIIRYHIVPGRYLFHSLTTGATLGTALAGERVTFALDSGVFSANGIEISDPDNIGSNGVMHVLEGVLIPASVQEALAATPEPTPEPTAAATPEVGVAPERPDLLALLTNDPDARFTTLLAAIEAAGLNDTVSTGGPFTLLAPTNDAFAALFDQLGITADDALANRSLVSQVLLYHLVKGRSLYHNLTGGATLPTMLLGQSVTFALDTGVLSANGVEISDTDNIASNGVMHVVEGVLLPSALQAALTAATPEPTPEPTAVATEVGVAPERPDLLALLTNDPDARFTTLLAAIDAAGLNDTVSTGGPFTLLAPTNDAFAALFDQLGITADDALANRSLVNQVLLYHLVKGRSLYHNLTGGATLPTMLLGQSVTFALDTGVLSANGVEISDTDNIASNGVMHVVEGVLLPSALQAALTAATPEPTPEPTAVATEVGVAPERPNLIALLTDDPDGRFTTLLAMLDAAGQTSTLTGTGPFTLLAPTNDAFASMLEQFGLTEEQALANPNIITQVLLYHIIPGRYLYHNLTGGATLPTALSGQSVTFALDAGVLSANGIEISDTDNIASNGVMHVVEGIVLPPAIQSMLAVQEPTPEPTAEPTEVGVAPARPDLLALLTNDADARFTTLLAAVDAAGLSDSLTGAGPYTVLAPTNDAFDALFAQTSLSLDQLAAMPDVLSEILRFHVIPGRYLYHNLTTGATLNTALAGQSVTFALETGALTANGVEISDTDNIASNGVMHAVDAVLLPSDLQASLMSNPRIRVAHFSPDAGSVDIYVNGTLTSMTGVAFPDVTPWVNVNPGTYEIGIAPAGGAPVLTVSVDAASGQWLLIAVTGSQAQGTLQANVIAEDFSPLAADTARLSMFNGVEGSSPYNVTVDGNAVVIRLGYPGTLGNNDGYYSADVPAGTYSVQFVLTSQTSNVVLDLPDVTLDAGTSYLLAAAGSPDAPGAVNVATVVPAQ